MAQVAGNRWMSTFAQTEMSALLLRRDDLDRGCAGLADVVDVWFRAGEWSQQWHTLGRCVVALAAIDQRELAVQVIGAIEERATMATPPVMATLRTLELDTASELESGAWAPIATTNSTCRERRCRWPTWCVGPAPPSSA